jgi:transposase InsO family protein
LGHLSFQALKKLSSQGWVRGMPKVDHVDQLCDGCLASKHWHSLFLEKAEYHVEHRLDMVHGDLCGPIMPTTPGSKKLFLLLVDDFSRFMWLVLPCSKDEAADAIKRVRAQAESTSGRKLGSLQTDRGGKFHSAYFFEYCVKTCVQRQLTMPYSPQQNGVVEHRNQSVVVMA